jgi:hypothetical protein
MFLSTTVLSQQNNMKDGLLVPLVGQLSGDENAEGPVQVFSIPGPQGQQALHDLGTLPPARLVFPAQGWTQLRRLQA